MSWSVLYATPGSVELLPGAGALALSGHAPTVVPSGTSALAALLASLSTDQWGTLTVGNTFAVDPTSTGDSLFSWSNQGDWDAVHKIAYGWGGTHGSAGTVQRMWMPVYTDSTNLYTDPPIAIAGGVQSQPCHGHGNGPAVDTVTGDVYGLVCNDTSTIHRFIWSSQTWDTPFPAINPSGWSSNSSVACVFHPGLFGGAGGLVVAGIFNIMISPLPRNGTPAWTQIQGGAVLMGDAPEAAFCRRDGCAYVGGGASQDTNYPRIWRVHADGTATVIANAPTIAYGWNSGGGNGQLVDSGNIANGIMLLGGQGQSVAFAYNESADTWATSSVAVPSGLFNSFSGDYNLISCPTYGGILAMQGASDLVSTNQLWAWKH